MKNVEENIAFLEYTSPTIITEPSQLPFFSEHKTTVYVTKKQLELVQYVTKCTGQFLKSLMNIPGNTSFSFVLPRSVNNCAVSKVVEYRRACN